MSASRERARVASRPIGDMARVLFGEAMVITALVHIVTFSLQVPTSERAIILVMMLAARMAQVRLAQENRTGRAGHTRRAWARPNGWPLSNTQGRKRTANQTLHFLRLDSFIIR